MSHRETNLPLIHWANYWAKRTIADPPKGLLDAEVAACCIDELVIALGFADSISEVAMRFQVDRGTITDFLRFIGAYNDHGGRRHSRTNPYAHILEAWQAHRERWKECQQRRTTKPELTKANELKRTKKSLKELRKTKQNLRRKLKRVQLWVRIGLNPDHQNWRAQ